MSAKPLLKIDNATAGYGKSVIFENVNFDINEGEIFGLIGLNGVGKTTLIKVILGLKKAIDGGVSFQEGKDFSYLPERFDPPWFLSGFEFLNFSLKLYGKTIKFEIAEQAALEVGLDPTFLKKRVSTYSKGMRQKLGLLATTLSECSLLILDEPMSGLDPRARADVKAIISKTREQGRSVFMSSHILSDMQELCDRVAVFDGGQVVFLGTPAELLKQGKAKGLETAFLNVIDTKSK